MAIKRTGGDPLSDGIIKYILIGFCVVIVISLFCYFTGNPGLSGVPLDGAPTGIGFTYASPTPRPVTCYEVAPGDIRCPKRGK